jgi:hypothetical protein
MTSHLTGITVEIVGIEASTNGRSCEEHALCGSVVCDDVVVRLRRVQIINQEQGKEETATLKSNDTNNNNISINF